MVYLRRGKKINGKLHNVRYRTGDVFVTQVELEPYCILVDPPEKPAAHDLVVTTYYQQRTKWDVFIVPYLFCPAMFVNFPLQLNGTRFTNRMNPGIQSQSQLELDEYDSWKDMNGGSFAFLIATRDNTGVDELTMLYRKHLKVYNARGEDTDKAKSDSVGTVRGVHQGASEIR